MSTVIATLGRSFMAEHSYRVEVIDGPEKGRCMYVTSYRLALQEADEFRYNAGSRARIVSNLSGEVLQEAPEGLRKRR